MVCLPINKTQTFPENFLKIVYRYTANKTFANSCLEKTFKNKDRYSTNKNQDCLGKNFKISTLKNEQISFLYQQSRVRLFFRFSLYHFTVNNCFG